MEKPNMKIPDAAKARNQRPLYAMLAIAAVIAVALTAPAAGAPGAGERIYVLDTGNHRVQIFNAQHEYQDQFTHLLDLPSGIAAGSDVYVKDGNQNCEVDKFTGGGKYLLQFGKCSSGSIGPGIFDNTGALAIAGANVWITSPDFYYMQQFTSSGKFLRIVCFANLGIKNCPQATTFDVQPFGIALDAKGNIYVTNQYPLGGGNNVVKFSSKGKYLATIGSSGNGDGQFNDPEGIAIDSAGNIYVVDTGNDRVEKFNRDGVYQSQFGSSGSGNGEFSSPVGIAFGANGGIYVADSGNNRVEEFDRDGTYQGQFGSAGQGNGQFSNPLGVAIAP
jgi:tripartite motif-containing protein 71